MKEIERRVLEKAPKVICTAMLLVAALFLSAFLSPTLAQTGNLGWNPEHPDLPLRQNTPDYILAGKVDVTVDPASKEATLHFNTVVPTSNSTVYYGLCVPQWKTAMPQYNFSSGESPKGENTVHELKLNLEDLQQAQNDASDFTRVGGIINYRISLQNPETKSLVNYYGRFCVDKDYDQQPCIVEGPFVDLLKPYGATISFETDRPTEASTFIEGNLYSDGQTAERHEIEIAGLRADTNYDYYIILDGRKDLRNYSFKTAPNLGSPSFKFAFMSDSRGCGEDGEVCSAGGVDFDTLTGFAIDGYSRGADLLVFGGDLVNGYCTIEDDYRLQLEAWKDASELVGSAMPIYEAVGNHEALMDVYEDGSTYGICFDKPDGTNTNTDTDTDNTNTDAGTDTSTSIGKSAEAVFAEEFVNPQDSFPQPENDSSPSYSENAYYFDYANSRFIVLNTNYWYSSHPVDYGGNLEGYVMDNQLQWMASLLDDAGENPYIKHIFLIGHEPVFSNDGKLDDPYLFQRKAALWKLISQNNKVVAALFGHEHYFSRMKVDRKTPLSSDRTTNPDFKYSVWQITSGNVGSPSYASGTAPWSSEVEASYAAKHYCLISVKGDKVELQVIDDSGKIVDQCMLKMGPKSSSAVENKNTNTKQNTKQDTKKEKAKAPCSCKEKIKGAKK